MEEKGPTTVGYSLSGQGVEIREDYKCHDICMHMLNFPASSQRGVFGVLFPRCQS